jgi:hypothetical protein
LPDFGLSQPTFLQNFLSEKLFGFQKKLKKHSFSFNRPASKNRTPHKKYSLFFAIQKLKKIVSSTTRKKINTLSIKKTLILASFATATPKKLFAL